MARLNAKWENFLNRGQIWDHFWQDDTVVIGKQVAQAQCYIAGAITYTVVGNAQSTILQTYSSPAQAQVSIQLVQTVHASTQTNILATYAESANAQAHIQAVYSSCAQSEVWVVAEYQVYSQAQAQILTTNLAAAQALSHILTINHAVGNSAAQILATYPQNGQAQTQIKQEYLVYANAQTDIQQTYLVYAQAQGWISRTEQVYAQAEVHILATYTALSQAQVHIFTTYLVYSQAEVYVSGQAIEYQAFAQAGTIVQIPGLQKYFYDSFSRTTTAPPFNVGNADTGTPWVWNSWDSDEVEALTPLYVDGSALVHGIPNGQTYSSMHNIGASIDDGELFIDIWMAAASDNDARTEWYDKHWNIQARNSGTTDDTTFYFRSRPKPDWIAVSDAITTRSAWYRLRVIVDSSSSSEYVKAHIWKIGDTEPVTWTVVQEIPLPENHIDWAANGSLPAIIDIYYTPLNEPAKFDNITVTGFSYTVYNQGFGNAQAVILAPYQVYAQAQAVLNQGWGIGQAEAHIYATSAAVSQAQAHILTQEIQVYSQAQAVLNQGWGIGQTQGHIIVRDNNAYAQARVLSALQKITTIYSDTFTRTVSNGWGTPDVGNPPYTLLWQSSNTTWSVNESKGLITIGVGTSSGGVDLKFGQNLYNFELYFETKLTVINDPSANLSSYFLIRDTGVGSDYWNTGAEIYVEDYYLSISATYGAGATSRSDLPYNPQVVNAIKIKADENTIYVKFWPITESEPIDWQLSYILTAPQNLVPGFIMWEPYANHYANTTNPMVIEFDNINIIGSGSFIYNQSYASANAQILTTYTQVAQAQVIINQSMHVAQSQTWVYTIYQTYSQAQAFIRKLAGYAQAQVRIAISPSDSYSYMVSQDGAASYWPMDVKASSGIDIIDGQNLTPGYQSQYNSYASEQPGINPSLRKSISFSYYYTYLQNTSTPVRLRGPQWTVESWARFDTLNSRFPIFSAYNGNNDYISIGLGGATSGSSGNYISVYHYFSNAYHAYTNNTTININTWYYLALTNNNGLYTLYVNGVQAAQWSAPSLVANALYIAYDALYNLPASGNAWIDGLAAYDIVLTQSQITNHFIAGNTQAYAQAQALINLHWAFAQARFWLYNPAPGATNIWQTFSQAQTWAIGHPTQSAQAQVSVKAFDVQKYAQAQTVIIPMQGMLRYFIQGSTQNYFLPDQGTYAQITSMTAVTDPGQINEGDWGSNYGVRWQSWFVADMSGNWYFETRSDDGSGIFIYNEQNQLVGSMNNGYGTGHGAQNASGTITLIAGVKYKIDVKHAEGGSGAEMSAWYRRPGGTTNTYLLAGEAPWNDKSKLPEVRYWGIGLANTLWVERNGDFYVWPKYAQAQAKIWYPGQKGYAQALTQVGAFKYAQAITQIAYEVPDTYRTAVLADDPILYYPLDEQSNDGFLHTIVGRRDAIWSGTGATFNGASAIGTGSSIDFNGLSAYVPAPTYYSGYITEALTFPGAVPPTGNWKVSNSFWLNAGDTVTITLNNVYNSGSNISLGLNDLITNDNPYDFIGSGPVTGTYYRTAGQSGVHYVYIYPQNPTSPTGSGTVTYPNYQLSDSAIPVTDNSVVTVEAWIKPDLTSGDPKMLFGFGKNYIGVWAAGRIGFGDGDGHYYYTAAGTLVANTTWYHIAAVFYSYQACTSYKLYINGALQTLTASGTNAVRSARQDFTIGGWPSNGSYKWTSPMDELSIFDHELTVEQILAHYRAYKKQAYAQANVWAVGHPTQTGLALHFTGRQPDGWFRELKYYGQAQAHVIVRDITGTSAQARALIQSDYGLTRMTWDNARHVVGDIFDWNSVEWELGQPNYSSSGNLPTTYPGNNDWGMAWSGNFVADVTGTWQFRTSSDDGSDLWISNTRVVNNRFGEGHSNTTVAGTIDLVQGNFYTIHTRFGQGTVTWNISAQYKRPGDSTWYYLTDNAPPWIRKYWHGGFAQALAEILPIPNVQVHGYAEAKLNSFDYPQWAQAQADILQTYQKYAQAGAVLNRGWGLAQSKALINYKYNKVAQAQTIVNQYLKTAQAEAKLNAFNVPKHASTKVHIKVYGVTRYAQARAQISRTMYASGIAAVSIKQTYPFRYISTNYGLQALGTTVTPDPDFSLEGSLPENVLDGSPYSVWTNFLAIDVGADQYFYLNLDLGVPRTIRSYYILPVKYNATANLQYSTNGEDWTDIVTDIYFDVRITYPISYSHAIFEEIPPTTARYWRLKFTSGGDDNKVSIATFQLGVATTQNPTFAQAQAFFGRFGVAQAMSYTSPGLSTWFGQAQAHIQTTSTVYAQAQCWYLPPTSFGLAQAHIVQIYKKHGLAMVWALPPTAFGLSEAHITTTYMAQGNALADIKTTYSKYAQALAQITKCVGHAQAMVRIYRRSVYAGQARVFIGHFAHGTAAAFIIKNKVYAQAQAQIKNNYGKYAQALVLMRRSEAYGHSHSWIVRTYYKQAQSLAMLNQYRMIGLAKVACVGTYAKVAQAGTKIRAISNIVATAQCVVTVRPQNQGQAAAFILIRSNRLGLAMAQIGAFKYAQAQARIIAFDVPKVANAAGYILVDATVPSPYPTSNLQSYLVMYSNKTLPGYAQNEFMSSVARFGIYNSAYRDGSLVEYLGLENKDITLRMLVWEPSYLECKIRVQEAATILRSKRKAFAKLYIQHYNKYYEAMVKSLKTDKTVGSSVKILEYEIEFEAKPWLISNEIYTLIGTGSIETDGRTLLDGGWTPTVLIVSGTDITISGVTEYGEATGSIEISGTVSNYMVDSENFETSDNTLITPKDYGLYVGPGKTTFTITGATDCRIEYHNRWYI